MSKNQRRWIIGKRAIQEVLACDKRRLIKIVHLKRGGELLERLEQERVPTELSSARKLEALTGSTAHQGIAAWVHERQFASLDKLLDHERVDGLLLICDSITDPQNFGAILRSAECLGAVALIFSKNRGVGLTPSVSKASSGASETLPLIQVSNLAQAVKRVQDEGGYEVLAAQKRPGAISFERVGFKKKTALMFGSEQKGLRPLLSRYADRSVMIPTCGQIDSLNVAQSVAVLSSAYLRARLCGELV